MTRRAGYAGTGGDAVAVMIGTSGWHYPHWKGRLYPSGLPASRWLAYYSARFATVEINNAFYRLPETSTFQAWADALPDGFVVAVKASRYLTHILRLRDPAEPVARLLTRAGALGAKLGPVLLQLPPTLHGDPGLLAAALDAFPSGIRVAVEPRHDSWYVPAVRGVLEARGAALCLADRRGPISPLWVTAEWGYVRFHAGRGQPPTGYGRAALATWAERLGALWPPEAEVFAYFNNDAYGCAPRDAHQLAIAVAHTGRVATRVPARRETPVG